MKKKAKVFWAGAGAIFLGAVGSGAWEYALKPLLESGTNTFLQMATLGVQSFQDDLYLEVAKGFHEKASFSLARLLNSLFVYGFLFLAAISVFKLREFRKKEADLLSRVDKLRSGVQEPELESKDPLVELQEIEDSLKGSKSKSMLRMGYFSFVVSVVFCLSLMLGVVKDSYANKAVTHYFQLVRIVAPYVDESEIIRIHSEFSQIETSRDYREIVGILYGYIDKYNLRKPRFDVW